MDSEITQEQDMDMNDDITPEDAKAALGLSTRLSEQMLMSMAPQMTEEAPLEATEAPQGEVPMENGEQPQQDHSMALEGKMDEKLEILRTEMKDTIKLEIEGIRNQIKEALDDSED